MIPAGIILLWSGSIASIPSGWVLCNGSNSTPDLRDRFVVGAGTTYAVNATGGANTVTLDATMIPAHTHTFSATTSAVSNNHTHTFSGTTTQENTGHTHSISDPGHRHLVTTSGIQGSVAVSGSNYVAYDTRVGSGLFSNENFEYTLGGTPNQPNAGLTSSNTTGITGTGDISNNHNHNYSGTTSGMSADHTHTLSGTSGSTGGGLAHENRPPYFALAYIMKT